jgi:hypothetical protein
MRIKEEARKKNFERAKIHAGTKGGICLSEEYIHSTDIKMLWKCSNPSHTPWLASFNSVIDAGSWCRLCKPGGNRARRKIR